MSRSFALPASHEGAESRDRTVVVGLTLACALVMLYLGVPRMVSAFMALPGDKALVKLSDGKTVAPDELKVFANSRRRAAALVGDAKLRAQFGLARLRMVLDREQGAPVDTVLLDGAIGALHESLARAPADRAVWLRLGLAKLMRNGPTPAVADAVRMSLFTGFHDRGLMILRLELAFRVWRHFDAEDRALIFRQIRAAWKAAPLRLLDVTNRPGRLGVVRAALASSPGQLERLELVRRRHRDRWPAAKGGRAPARRSDGRKRKRGR